MPATIIPFTCRTGQPGRLLRQTLTSPGDATDWVQAGAPLELRAFSQHLTTLAIQIERSPSDPAQSIDFAAYGPPVFMSSPDDARAWFFMGDGRAWYRARLVQFVGPWVRIILGDDGRWSPDLPAGYEQG